MKKGITRSQFKSWAGDIMIGKTARRSETEPPAEEKLLERYLGKL